MFKKYILFLIVSFSFFTPMTQAEEGDVFLDINLLSIHDPSTYVEDNNVKDYNDDTHGLGVTYDLAKHYQLKFGWYKNSYNEPSWYGGINIKTDWKYVQPGIAFVGVTGYDDTIEETAVVAFLALPNLSVPINRDHRLFVGYIPKFGEYETQVLTLQYQYRL